MSHHEETSALLRERGCRATPQRLLILDILRRAQRHLSAEEIHSQVAAAFPGVDISTVYRTLELFSELELVRKSNLGADHSHFEWSIDPHHHLVCQACGQVQHVSDEELEGFRQKLERTHRFSTREIRLTVFGLCEDCLSAS